MQTTFEEQIWAINKMRQLIKELGEISPTDTPQLLIWARSEEANKVSAMLKDAADLIQGEFG